MNNKEYTLVEVLEMDPKTQVCLIVDHKSRFVVKPTPITIVDKDVVRQNSSNDFWIETEVLLNSGLGRFYGKKVKITIEEADENEVEGEVK